MNSKRKKPLPFLVPPTVVTRRGLRVGRCIGVDVGVEDTDTETSVQDDTWSDSRSILLLSWKGIPTLLLRYSYYVDFTNCGTDYTLLASYGGWIITTIIIMISLKNPILKCNGREREVIIRKDSVERRYPYQKWIRWRINGFKPV